MAALRDLKFTKLHAYRGGLEVVKTAGQPDFELRLPDLFKFSQVQVAELVSHITDTGIRLGVEFYFRVEVPRLAFALLPCSPDGFAD